MRNRETAYTAIPGHPGSGRPDTRVAGDRQAAEPPRSGTCEIEGEPDVKTGKLLDFASAKAMKGMSNGSLNPKQKAALAAAASMAYRLAGRHSGMSCDEWRHDQVLQVTGKAGLRECSQGDYKKLAGHFARLQGDQVKAFRAFVGAGGGTQDRELALAKLRHAEREADKTGLLPVPAEQYVGGFFKNRKTTRDYASATVVVHAMFTLQRRLSQLRGKARKQEVRGQRSEVGSQKGGVS